MSWFKRFCRWLLRAELLEYEKDIHDLGEYLFDLNDKYEHLREFNAHRYRVGSVDIDPVALTAVVRTIEPSMRVESDGRRLVIYSENPLDNAQKNAVLVKMKREVNLT